MADEYNPIISVDGKAVRCPSGYQWKLQDISDSDAGRTEDTVMVKKRIGQCVKLELEWQNITTAEASAILKAFNPEYITICYLDAMAGKYVTSEFYVGDRSAPMYNCRKGIWSNVAFNVIERSGV
jgi:hypothetical protein